MITPVRKLRIPAPIDTTPPPRESTFFGSEAQSATLANTASMSIAPVNCSSSSVTHPVVARFATIPGRSATNVWI